MKYLLLILSMSILLAGEMEVDGDLKVTGTVESATIDSLQQQINSLLLLIADLEFRIANMECLNTGIIPEGSCDCYGNALDLCGECGGDAVSEDECPPTDIDGNTYETVEIGNQTRMAENLKVTHYNNGDEIPTGYSGSEWNTAETGAYGVYDNNPENSETYGRLYNWFTVDDSRGVCPDGWHVPSDAEYTVLTDYLGGESVAGGKMKETGLDHWNSPNTDATNESGFTGLPAGYRQSGTSFYINMGANGYFWSLSHYFGNYAWFRFLDYGNSNVNRDYYGKEGGFSIRCLKD